MGSSHNFTFNFCVVFVYLVHPYHAENFPLPSFILSGSLLVNPKAFIHKDVPYHHIPTFALGNKCIRQSDDTERCLSVIGPKPVRSCLQFIPTGLRLTFYTECVLPIGVHRCSTSYQVHLYQVAGVLALVWTFLTLRGLHFDKTPAGNIISDDAAADDAADVSQSSEFSSSSSEMSEC